MLHFGQGQAMLEGKCFKAYFLHFPNDDKQNYPYCRLKWCLKSLETTCLEPINQNLVEVLKLFSQQIR